jgi:hypothetical protein
MHVYLFCEIEKKKDAMYVSKESARKNEEKVKRELLVFYHPVLCLRHTCLLLASSSVKYSHVYEKKIIKILIDFFMFMHRKGITSSPTILRLVLFLFLLFGRNDTRSRRRSHMYLRPMKTRETPA